MTGFAVFLVSLGGFCGAISRYYVSRGFSKRFPSSPPYGTLAVNLLGSFVLGCLLGGSNLSGEGQAALYNALGIGFCGAFTTYSTFAFETMQMLIEKRFSQFLLYIGTTYVIGIACVFAGYYAAA